MKIYNSNHMTYRSDERLINAIKKIGLKESSGACADLIIEDVYSGFRIDDYDGRECIRY